MDALGVGGGLMLSGVDPRMADLPDDVLRREFLECSQALLRVPAPR
jgi:hypothetical protein